VWHGTITKSYWVLEEQNAVLPAVLETNARRHCCAVVVHCQGDIHQALNDLDVKTYYYQGKIDQQTAGNISR
jgi:hypothetical protein